MSEVTPAVFADADTLLNLAQDPKALHAVVDALGGRAHVTTAVREELDRSVAHDPPAPNARRALSAALEMREIDPFELGPAVMTRTAELREPVAMPGESNRKHLGESSSVACAEAMGGLVASDDSDARSLARVTGVHVVTTGDLLTRMVQVGRLTRTEAEEAMDRMVRAGRGVEPNELRC